jgi:hypothetical protein
MGNLNGVSKCIAFVGLGFVTIVSFVSFGSFGSFGSSCMLEI